MRTILEDGIMDGGLAQGRYGYVCLGGENGDDRCVLFWSGVEGLNWLVLEIKCG